jgi:ketosteroid isomerase-like protein
MTTKELLDGYYNGLAEKNGWDAYLSDDFQFTGGDMLHPEPQAGKDAYATVLNRFSRLFHQVRVKEMIIEGDKAFVRANYDYVFPGGKKVNGDVAELWRVKDGKLHSLTIFFDTLAFRELTQPVKE